MSIGARPTVCSTSCVDLLSQETLLLLLLMLIDDRLDAGGAVPAARYGQRAVHDVLLEREQRGKLPNLYKRIPRTGIVLHVSPAPLQLIGRSKC